MVAPSETNRVEAFSDGVFAIAKPECAHFLCLFALRLSAGATLLPKATVAISSREHLVVPITNHKRLDEALENERVFLHELFGRRSRPEDRHVSEIRERTDADHLASCDKSVDDRLVSRVDRRDRLHRGARSLTNDDSFHRTLLGQLSQCGVRKSRTQAATNVDVLTVEKISGVAKKNSNSSTPPPATPAQAPT